LPSRSAHRDRQLVAPAGAGRPALIAFGVPAALRSTRLASPRFLREAGEFTSPGGITAVVSPGKLSRGAEKEGDLPDPNRAAGPPRSRSWCPWRRPRPQPAVRATQSSDRPGRQPDPSGGTFAGIPWYRAQPGGARALPRRPREQRLVQSRYAVLPQGGQLHQRVGCGTLPVAEALSRQSSC